jgi:hypothetical protein
MMLFAYHAQSQFDVKLHITEGIVDTAVKSAIENNSSLFLSEIGNAFAEGRTPDFTNIAVSPEASKTVLDTWLNTSVMNCSVSKLDRTCTKRCDGGYQVRDIPVIMHDFAADDTLQKIAINYTVDGTIDEIYVFADSFSVIMPTALEDNEKCRLEKIIDFIELYHTAHRVKDLDFIRKVFDPIILITKKRKAPPVEIPDYEKMSNAQYLRKIRYVFTMNKYVNPEFEELEIRQHPKYAKIYGVIIKQLWNTDIYKDSGYVFLMIDFENENDPKIPVCLWRPENHETLSKDEIFNLYMFNITR